MPDNIQRPDDVHEFSGINKVIQSKTLQFIVDKLHDGTFSDFMDDWKWIFTFSKQYKGAIVFYTLLGIVSSTLGLVSSVAGKYMIDIITGYQFSKLWLLAVILVASAVVSLAFSSLVSRFSAKISIYVNNRIQASIFSDIMDADWLELSKYRSGDLLNRFNSDVNTVATNAVSWIPNLIIAVYNFVAIFCVIFYYDVTMAWIALSSAPVLILVSQYIMRKNKAYRKRVLELNSGMMSFESETFANVDTIKSFGITEHYRRGLFGWQEKYKEYNLDYNMFSIKTNIGLSSLSTAVSLVAFGYCLFRLWTGGITYGTMTLFLTQRSRLSTQFSNLVNIIPGMLNSSVSAHRIRELTQLKREVHQAEESEEMAKAAAAGFAVRMRDVDFSYVEGTKVIRDTGFVASPGEIVALVGPSGEGKTTMIRLILGLVRPDDGVAEIMDSDGNAVGINADTRRYFSYVPQGNTILSGTVAENLRMVKEDATDDEVVDALKAALAWNFVVKLPGGINGKLGERGRGVSEGQAQRIAIARAILRDAPVLLLDEATSALDVATERKVLRNILERRPNKTVIVTTHRPSVLDMCQRVYRVTDGRVTEQGEEDMARMMAEF